MSQKRTRIPGPVQRERSAATRTLVLEATAALIAEGGPQAATAKAISQRSGVSWGGIQHQFGNKGAILDGVVDQLIGDLGGVFRGIQSRAQGTLEERVEVLVATVWEAVRHPSYRTLVTILRERAQARPLGDPDPTVMAARSAAGHTAQAVFADLDLDAETVDLVDAFCFGALAGLADQQLLAPIHQDFTVKTLALVQSTVVQALRS